jgi:hypothetical protein
VLNQSADSQESAQYQAWPGKWTLLATLKSLINAQESVQYRVAWQIDPFGHSKESNQSAYAQESAQYRVWVWQVNPFGHSKESNQSVDAQESAQYHVWPGKWTLLATLKSLINQLMRRRVRNAKCVAWQVDPFGPL